MMARRARATSTSRSVKPREEARSFGLRLCFRHILDKGQVSPLIVPGNRHGQLVQLAGHSREVRRRDLRLPGKTGPLRGKGPLVGRALDERWVFQLCPGKKHGDGLLPVPADYRKVVVEGVDDRQD